MRAEAGPYRVEDIVRACEGTILCGPQEAAFDAICTDSRQVRPGDLFVPIRGERFDGNEFILPALEAGARGSLVDGDIHRVLPHIPADCVLIQVEDTLPSLSDLASAHRITHTFPLIAVTGSSGKTTVKEMIAGILSLRHRPLVSKGNFNNMIGLPMTILSLSSSHTAAVVEAGINTKGEMSRLAHAALPDIAVITTAGPVHLEGLGTIAGVAEEKYQLVRALRPKGRAILPEANGYLRALLKEFPVEALLFGLERGDVTARNVEFGSGTKFAMVTPWGEREIFLKVPGRHNVLNALAAAAACLSIGCGPDEAAEGLALFTAPPMRMELIPLTGGRVLIRDCYNANPQSMKAALEVLAAKGRAGLALLADMKELGPQAEAFHEEIGREAARLHVGRVVFVGDYGPAFEKGFIGAGGDPGSVNVMETAEDAWRLVLPILSGYEVVLVKGSRSMRMEIMADRILEEK
ncbi:MAG: UDP-N-acetylmuramoyl-tripeptide--D-alanyl-D-alanine ligase [Pseudomonadota bacterium]